MKSKSQTLIVGTTLLCASIHLGASRTAFCAEKPSGAASVRLDNVGFYKAPLVCPAAPHIGCGSASKPLLLELERSDVVSEAWLNRARTVMAILGDNACFFFAKSVHLRAPIPTVSRLKILQYFPQRIS